MAEDEQAELDDEDSPLEPGSLEAERYNVEILRGVQLMSPRPAAPHAKVAASLLISLGNEFSRGRGGRSGRRRLVDPVRAGSADARRGSADPRSGGVA